MAYRPYGKHLIRGAWIGSATTFASQPIDGLSHETANGDAKDVDRAVQAAEDAFWTFGYTSRAERAAFLRSIAEEIDARADEITEIGVRETGLPEARLQGERGRTTGQLRLFADHIEVGEYLDHRHDPALPDRQPLARPDLKMVQRPIGPVAVFGASNFPLAFSTAGGDTASALAAGCPVVIKGHPAHPGTGEIIAEAVLAAITKCDLHPGCFNLVQGNTKELGAALVQHPLIAAVGFTGSLGAGRALFDLCASRPTPIPFFGELGSVNPIFLLPEAMSARSEALAQGWAASLTMGAGQFCTNPGVVVLMEGPSADFFTETARLALSEVDAQTMLTEGIANSYRAGCERVADMSRVTEVLNSAYDGRRAKPYLSDTTGEEWLANDTLAHEIFGPFGVIVRVKDREEMLAVARSLRGQLTCTLMMDESDSDLAHHLMPVLERKAGRILTNGYPTGVEVCDSMVHGGPYPASTNFGATSVGTLAIRRFLRPVCYQNMPDALLPIDVSGL